MGEEESSISGIEQVGSRKESRETAKDAKKKKELKPRIHQWKCFSNPFYLSDLRGSFASFA